MRERERERERERKQQHATDCRGVIQLSSKDKVRFGEKRSASFNSK